jgi:hypothetical protein
VCRVSCGCDPPGDPRGSAMTLGRSRNQIGIRPPQVSQYAPDENPGELISSMHQARCTASPKGPVILSRQAVAAVRDRSLGRGPSPGYPVRPEHDNQRTPSPAPDKPQVPSMPLFTAHIVRAVTIRAARVKGLAAWAYAPAGARPAHVAQFAHRGNRAKDFGATGNPPERRISR